MDIFQLRTFLAVASSRSYTVAAKESYTTRQSVSHAIRTLEAELETKLFVYENRHLYLTESGKEFELRAREVVNSFDSLVQDINRVSSGQNMPLKLCIDDTLVPQAMPSIISCRNQVLGDQSQICINQDDSEQCIQHVRNGMVDACLLRVEAREFSDLEVVELSSGQLAFLVSRTSPLAQKEAISLSDLDQQSLFMPADYKHRFRDLYSECTTRGISFNADFRINCNSDAFITELKNCEIAIAVKPRDNNRFDKNRLAVVGLEDGRHIITDYLCFRKENPRASEILQLCDYLRNSMY